LRYYGTRTNERWAAVKPARYKRRNTMILNSYLIEQWARELQSQRRAEAESYNTWARARKALRNSERSHRAK
jgi:hypothetical protein